MIQAENITIDPELCKRLDTAIYQTDTPPQVAIDKASLYRTEILTLLAKYNQELADKLKTRSLYYLYCVLTRVIQDEGEHCNERMRANAHTAHMQLKNWK